MKHLKLIISTLVLTGLITSCGTMKLKGEKPVMNAGVPEVIDYQGQALGSAVPAWVIAIGDGAQKKVKKALDIDKDQTIFILQNKGTDLDFLKIWTDQIDARAEVAASIEQTVGQTIEAELSIRDVDTQTKERAAKIYSGSMTNLTLNGLTKEASYWIKTRTLKPNAKNKRKESSYNVQYTYYVVFSIETDIYNQQIEQAMKDIEDNDSQTSFLKDMITDKLKQSVVAPEGENISFTEVKVEKVD